VTSIEVPILDRRVFRALQQRKAGAAPADVQPFAVVLKPSGGELIMRSVASAPKASTVECGDVDRSRPGAPEPGSPVVQFRPAAASIDDPLAREIYAVTTSKPLDPVPRTELRLSGGAEDKSDVSPRLSFGARKAGSTDWSPRVSVDGGRRVDIIAKPGKPALAVNGAVYLPSIGKDDPLMPELLSMAFMAGLRQAGRFAVTTEAAIGKVTSIARGTKLTYDLTISYVPGTVVRRAVELIRGIADVGDLTFRSIPGISVPNPPTSHLGGKAAEKFKIELENFVHRATKVRLEVVLLVAENDVPRLAVSKHLDINVT
jgi:hypothetical protein